MHGRLDAPMRRPKYDRGLGYCLNCGARLTFCGRTFSGEFVCMKCGVLNVYVNSQQPQWMKVIPDMRPEYYKRKYPITSKQEVSGPPEGP